ncbi:carbohydrate esterase family 16 protein [Ramaria rubella]|nr:carbohydrate esterase family 16 protein [Ramaria rubella]
MLFHYLSLLVLRAVRTSGTVTLPQPPVKNFVVFGDSYSDDCNFWRLTNPPATVAEFPFPSCPPPPTGRADDGLQWPETVRNISDIRVVNLAFSGATCNNTDFPRTHQGSFNGTVVDPDVTSQIQQYIALKDPSIKTPDETVAAIFIGTNDLGFFLQIFRNNETSDILPPGVQITDEANCVVKQVQTLYSHGLRRFLIFQTIPLQDVSQYSADIDNGNPQPGAFLSAFMAQLVSANNALQAIQLANLQKILPGSDIQIFPTFDFYAQRVANPKAFLGPNGTSTGFCNTNLGPCTDPQDFLFWDDLHPGLVANNQLAAAVVAFLRGDKNVTGPGL